ncbi:MAG: hypothetical protein J6U69_03550 [Alistipes sp.]|nr:hypothetical protein [Alistipes sp.]
MEIIKNGLVEATERVSAVVNDYEITANVQYSTEGVKNIQNGVVVKEQNQVANFQRWGHGSKSIGYTTPDEAEQDNIHAMLKEFFSAVDAMYNA